MARIRVATAPSADLRSPLSPEDAHGFELIKPEHLGPDIRRDDEEEKQGAEDNNGRDEGSSAPAAAIGS